MCHQSKNLDLAPLLSKSGFFVLNSGIYKKIIVYDLFVIIRTIKLWEKTDMSSIKIFESLVSYLKKSENLKKTLDLSKNVIIYLLFVITSTVQF